ncbi:MAG: DNA polymerase III subunit delta [Patescibacteria group bacterium]|jgi:DNA polymerase-3 subunit delta
MIIFLYGPDDFRAKRKLNELKEKFRREINKTGTDLAEIDGEKATLRDINELIAPASLFSKKRMVVVENIFLNKSTSIFGELAKLLIKEEKGENIIIFRDSIAKKDKLTGPKAELFKLLSGQKYSQEFLNLSRSDLIKWVKSEALASEAEVSPEAATLLSALSENLWQAKNELEKIIAFKKASLLLNSSEEKNASTPVMIEEQDVYNMVRGKLDTNIFSLTDAIGAGNKGQALKLLEEQIESGAAETYLLTMILRQFKIILRIRDALDSGGNGRSIASSLKLHPFIVQKGISQARFFSPKILKKILSRLVRMDYELKTGQGDLKTGLTMLIAGLK